MSEVIVSPAGTWPDQKWPRFNLAEYSAVPVPSNPLAVLYRPPWWRRVIDAACRWWGGRRRRALRLARYRLAWTEVRRLYREAAGELAVLRRALEARDATVRERDQKVQELTGLLEIRDAEKQLMANVIAADNARELKRSEVYAARVAAVQPRAAQ